MDGQLDRAETSYLVQKQVGGAGPFVDLATVPVPSLVNNTAGAAMSYVDAAFAAGDRYQVIAQNTVGDLLSYGLTLPPGTTSAFPTVTAKSAPVLAP